MSRSKLLRTGQHLALSIMLAVCLEPAVIAAQKPGFLPQARIVSDIDDTDLRQLSGNTHPLARPGHDAGEAPADLPMERMLLVLSRSQQQESALQDVIRKQHDPSSEQFHRWLTPVEFGQQFGAADSDIEALTGWLRSNGLEVARVAKGRGIIEFSGTAKTVARAFHTQIRKYVVNGEEHWANASDPAIPAALTPVVAGIASLHTFGPKSQIVRSSPTRQADGQVGIFAPQYTTSGGNHYLSPGDYSLIYNINPLYQAGITGAGTTIAVVGRTRINLQDVTDFRRVFGLSSNTPQIIVNGPDPGIVSEGEEVEAVLDTSWAGAIAPGANVKLVISKSTNASDGVELSEEFVIDNNLADVMTESFGYCEAWATQAYAAFINSMAAQAAAQGITHVVSSGDTGAAGCNDPNQATANGPQSVNLLASTPYSVAVGGTQFTDYAYGISYWNSQNDAKQTSARGYIPEQVWENGALASGGGVSTFFSRPDWQYGVTGIPINGSRNIPDVSLTAAGQNAYLLCVRGSCGNVTNGQPQFWGVYGTSASAPSFAGIMALVNQRTGARQGQANYVLYRVARGQNFGQCNASSSPQSNCIFNDITVGENNVSFPFSNGYWAGVGYDMTTGLGSVNAANLVNQWDSGLSLPRIRIAIDHPGHSDGPLSGTVSFAGWALDDAEPVTTVEVSIDSVSFGFADYGGVRQDVCAAYPNRPGCPNFGWNFALDASRLTDGPHTLSVTATAASGQTYSALTSFTVANSVADPIKIHVDSPGAQSSALSGATLFWGWAIDDFAAMSSVAVSIDGVSLGKAAYGGSRPDVCDSYPGRQDCPNVGWSIPLDTRTLSDGSHVLQVSGTSAGGRTHTLSTTFATANFGGEVIRMSIDQPISQSPPLSGVAAIGGWALSDQSAITSVSVLVDGAPFGAASYGGLRSDVCADYPNRPGCPRVGWNAFLDTTRLADGEHSLQIRSVTASGASSTVTRSFQTVNLANNSIKVMIDSPNSNNGPLAGTVGVAGWALDDNGAITSVEMRVDGLTVSAPTYGLSRVDVCGAYPGRLGCPNFGWVGQLDTTLLANGQHVLNVTAYSSTGLHATSSAKITVGNWLHASTRIDIDAPGQNGNPITGPVNFYGWAIDDYSSVASISITIDGIAYGKAIYGGSRPDVCKAFPGRDRCPNVGWSYYFDPKLFTDGVHLLEVTATTSAGWRLTNSTAFTVRNSSSYPFTVDIDLPAGSRLQGVASIYGWAMNDPYWVQQVQISIDGILLGPAHYGDPRPDVCQAFKTTWYPCPNVGWDYQLDTTRLSNGSHRLSVTAGAGYLGWSTVSKAFVVAN